MRIAIFDVSIGISLCIFHPLKDAGIEVIGISDTASYHRAPQFAEELNCELHSSNDTLLDKDFDFALVFSRHSRMADWLSA